MLRKCSVIFSNDVAFFAKADNISCFLFDFRSYDINIWRDIHLWSLPPSLIYAAWTKINHLLWNDLQGLKTWLKTKYESLKIVMLRPSTTFLLSEIWNNYILCKSDFLMFSSFKNDFSSFDYSMLIHFLSLINEAPAFLRHLLETVLYKSNSLLSSFVRSGFRKIANVNCIT